MISLNDYNKEQEVKPDSYTGATVFSENKFINWLISVIAGIIRFHTVKFVFGVLFVGVLSVAGFNVDWDRAFKMGSKAANDDWGGTYEEFRKDKKIQALVKGVKMPKLNFHPVYGSKAVKEWEEETGLKFDSIYAYVIITNDDKQEDMLVGKKKAFSLETKKPLKLDGYNVYDDDADDICNEDFLGEVPTEAQKSIYSKLWKLNIRKIKDELTQSDDDKESFFRCVIDQDRINDLMDN